VCTLTGGGRGVFELILEVNGGWQAPEFMGRTYLSRIELFTMANCKI